MQQCCNIYVLLSAPFTWLCIILRNIEALLSAIGRRQLVVPFFAICFMLIYFFNMSSYLAQNSQCLNYKNYSFGPTACTSQRTQ